MPRVAASEPAGCGYWRRAAAGEVFFTVADDHKRCPVGAHTHHVPLTSAEQDELMGLVKTMVDLSYLKMEDVPKIPRRQTPLQAAVYSPLSRAPIPPDVVLVRGNARQLMLLAEAAENAGVAGAAPGHGSSNLCRPARVDQCGPHRRQLRMCREPRVHGSRRRPTPTSRFQARTWRPSRRVLRPSFARMTRWNSFTRRAPVSPFLDGARQSPSSECEPERWSLDALQTSARVELERLIRRGQLEHFFELVCADRSGTSLALASRSEYSRSIR